MLVKILNYDLMINANALGLVYLHDAKSVNSIKMIRYELNLFFLVIFLKFHFLICYFHHLIWE
jgi:hypothetical protein